MLSGWKIINKTHYTIINNNSKNLTDIEYFNSFIYQIYNKMVFKIFDNNLVIYNHYNDG